MAKDTGIPLDAILTEMERDGSLRREIIDGRESWVLTEQGERRLAESLERDRKIEQGLRDIAARLREVD